MILEDLVRRLQTRKEDELGREKQSSPFDEDKRVAEQGSKVDWGRANMRQVP